MYKARAISRAISRAIYGLLMYLLAPSPSALAQTLGLFEQGTQRTVIEAVVGDTLEIEAQVQLGRFAVSGLVVFMSLEAVPFEILDRNPSDRTAIQPFALGGLFSGGVLMRNAVVMRSPLGERGRQWLEYAVLLGPSQGRGQTGNGSIATFTLRCQAPVHEGRLHIDVNPVRETRLLLADGFSERSFTAVQGLRITVKPPPTAVQGTSWSQIKEGIAPP